MPYSKKPGTTRSDLSDIFGESTTAATTSPTLRNHALSISGADSKKLEQVNELTIPKNAITDAYRKTRLLKKGCPKLIRLVDKHSVSIDKSLK